MNRAMGLDLGTKTIGVSLSDPMYLIAQSFETIQRKSFEEDLKRLKEIIEEKEVQEIVIGLPKNMDNSLGPSAQRSRSFADLLKKELDQEIYLQDERLTTKQAMDLLKKDGVRREKRKKHVDAIAATFILQSWLDKRR